jgi:S-adenosylmethionine-diacylgycerolhomoserine-N-methlytransferase
VSSIAAEARTLLTMLRGQPRSGTHAERLQAFYAPQAGHYDRFRERLLRGRDEILIDLPLRRGDMLIELGGGTGRNIAALGAMLPQLAHAEIVDLCPALLEQARARFDGVRNVSVVEADVTSYHPARAADVVLMSYALTMIPDWQGAIRNALAMLRPGGTLAVVDFCVSDQQPRWMGAFWQRWFGHDGVNLSAEHARALRAALPDHEYSEHLAAVPYLPSLRVPYYRFLGQS